MMGYRRLMTRIFTWKRQEQLANELAKLIKVDKDPVLVNNLKKLNTENLARLSDAICNVQGRKFKRYIETEK